MSTIEALPLFPLTSHLFPGGRLPLRIFEPRYVRMVKESFDRPHAFAMCMLDPSGDKASNTHIWPLATLVRVVDFDALDDGMLGITVEGVQKVEILSVDSETDGLRVGTVRPLPNWPEAPLDEAYLPLKEKLAEVYQSYPELGQLYSDPHWMDAAWLAQRWLEVVPLEAGQKQKLWAGNPNQALSLLDQLIQTG
ncbi:LON peptidase substrate-binding domain-containing protein [Ferrimonas balearica]|uniref:LON peptidase substrate-binding domain-containing protein n=1 Tax=Ferrimonas balearica TaxID=44012 RepID=UPI001C998508|nr:LON peptidase substrate-binding domain-containing protein [Ferrimonas balearica]MBY5992584.1 LON peptidase substrate-binding domain-containing protein [Ferrimonas balearica]